MVKPASGSIVEVFQKSLLALLPINKLFILVPMIQNFADKETEVFFRMGKSRRMPQEIQRRTAMRLMQLDAATVIEDLRLPPSNRLELLSGSCQGQWSIRINDQWRLCFRFANGEAFDVEVTD